MRAILLAACLAGVPTAALAWSDMERLSFATALGDILASEHACGLRYDQAAIGRHIDSKVPADDMRFTSTLDMMTSGASFNLEQMTESQKTAHCHQIERVAKAHGFIAN